MTEPLYNGSFILFLFVFWKQDCAVCNVPFEADVLNGCAEWDILGFLPWDAQMSCYSIDVFHAICELCFMFRSWHSSGEVFDWELHVFIAFHDPAVGEMASVIPPSATFVMPPSIVFYLLVEVRSFCIEII